MAKLILTDEEKAAPTYIEWSDEAIGRAVKALAAKVGDKHGQESMYSIMCATMLACQSSRINSTKTVIEQQGVTEADKELGDWRITIERVR